MKNIARGSLTLSLAVAVALGGGLGTATASAAVVPPTPAATATPTATAAPTATATPSATATPTAAPSPTASTTPSTSPAPTATPTPTAIPSPSAAPTEAPAPTATPAPSEARAVAPVAAATAVKPGSTSISGRGLVGQVLIADTFGWTPEEAVAFTYQWSVGGKSVAGATSQFYTTVAADAGKRVTVSVTGSSPGATPATRIASFPGSIAQYGSITGTVYQPGNPTRTVASGFVTLWPAYSKADEWVEPLGFADIVDGKYSFADTIPGSYTLQFIDSATGQQSFLGGGNMRTGSTALAVSSGRQTTKNFSFSATGSLSGTVVFKGPALEPGAYVEVEATSSRGTGYAAAAADGTFTITGLPGGSYTVAVRVYDSANYKNGQYTLGNGSVVGRASVAAGKTVTGVKITVKSAALLSGTVTAQSSGQAVPEASVQLYRVGGTNNGFITSTETKADGSFALPPLDAGTYQVAVVPKAGRGLALAFVGGPSESTARTLTVKDGDVLGGLTVALPVEAVLTGVILAGETGLPIASDYILYPLDGTLGVVQYTHAATDADGRLRVGGLPAGRYGLQIHPKTGDYPDQVWGQNTPGGSKVITLTAGQTTDIRVIALK
jgi:hypothetical protein